MKKQGIKYKDTTAMTQIWGCASLYDCGWTGPQPGRNKEGTEFCPNCGGFVHPAGVPEVDPSSLEQRLHEWADSLPAGTLGAVHMGTLMSVARGRSMGL